ncbi:MAG TPA: hypothetical protein VN695_10935 [Streptosporangiaceae bacterium]|nr:hypothetical protein [Streptosporangiaceae bacterium]
MSGDRDLRGVIIGLISFAAAEEQMLLAASDPAEPGDASTWAAVPMVAHNTEFKRQQVQRLEAIRFGHAPVEFGEIDHGSAQVYLGYLSQPADQVAADSARVASELIANLGLISDADLTDPARHAWLRGRQLWLQLIVRGFWHPTGHLAEYYRAHDRTDRAVALCAHGVLTARYLGAPDPARGMASYNLACAQAGANLLDQAAITLRQAIALNADLARNAKRDQDLAALTGSGFLGTLLADR